jgi:glycosyltransferase involved in cell wall biosynthesis
MNHMKILLLQSSVYFPSYGGGNKSNRLLMEALAKRGHQCWSISKSVNAQTVIDKTPEKMLLDDRDIQSANIAPGIDQYQYRQVGVFTVDSNFNVDLAEFIQRQCAEINPDILLVSDDKNGELLALGLAFSLEKTFLIVHTNLHLPFGDEATSIDPSRAKNYRMCKNIVTATRYTQTYLQQHAGIHSSYLAFPVFGEGPFKKLAQFQRGHIGMINPCAVKGIAIFIGLAEQFPHLNFLAVPTWGANAVDIRNLAQIDNMTIMSPKDDIEDILQQINILIVPSLIPETFGYVVVEAMLRGIPVLASDLGGLRDAKLGEPYLLPVNPAVNVDGSHQIPVQDLKPWVQALATLTEDAASYQQCSDGSYHAANHYVSNISVAAFEKHFNKGLSS